jgi:hypothetical protein
MNVNFNFKNALPSDQRNCAALIKQVFAAAAEWPARWTKAKAAGDKAKMQRLLREAEALGMMEKVLRAAEIQMRSAILTRQQGANKALREHNRHKAAKAGASFAKLISTAGLQDPFNEANRFKVTRRLRGGAIPFPSLGRDYVPALLDGGEFVLNRDATAREGVAAVSALNAGNARITLNAPTRNRNQANASTAPQGAQGEGTAGIIRANNTLIAELLAVLGRLKTVSKGEIVEFGLEERPGAAARAIENAFRNRSSSSAEIRRMNSIR